MSEYAERQGRSTHEEVMFNVDDVGGRDSKSSQKAPACSSYVDFATMSQNVFTSCRDSASISYSQKAPACSTVRDARGFAARAAWSSRWSDRVLAALLTRRFAASPLTIAVLIHFVHSEPRFARCGACVVGDRSTPRPLSFPPCTEPHRTAPNRTEPLRTAPLRTAPHSTATASRLPNRVVGTEADHDPRAISARPLVSLGSRQHAPTLNGWW